MLTPRREASCCCSPTKGIPLTKEVMKEVRREEEQGKEMQVELPAWEEEVYRLKEVEEN